MNPRLIAFTNVRGLICEVVVVDLLSFNLELIGIWRLVVVFISNVCLLNKFLLNF